jgi:hypothetical protein
MKYGFSSVKSVYFIGNIKKKSTVPINESAGFKDYSTIYAHFNLLNLYSTYIYIVSG